MQARNGVRDGAKEYASAALGSVAAHSTLKSVVYNAGAVEVIPHSVRCDDQPCAVQVTRGDMQVLLELARNGSDKCKASAAGG